MERKSKLEILPAMCLESFCTYCRKLLTKVLTLIVLSSFRGVHSNCTTYNIIRQEVISLRRKDIILNYNFYLYFIKDF